MESDSTIAALATPHGNAALAVIRVSGPDALSIVKNLVKKKERFEKAAFRRVLLCRLVKRSGETIDHATLIKYAAPQSFTGESAVEILCHGGMIVVERVLEALIGCGAVYARRGEFTKRAFLNGKMELAEAEAIERIVSSRSVAQHRSALSSYFGQYRGKLMSWRERLESLLVDTESSIEFGEDDDVQRDAPSLGIKGQIKQLRTEVETELERRKKLDTNAQGIQIAFVGLPNVGKSTLLNLVLGYERSIVFSKEGTTRDAVSEHVSWHGIDVRFVDSAGLRSDDAGEVEQIGVERAWRFVQESDYIVLVTSAAETWQDEEEEVLRQRFQRGGVLGVVNKTDLGCPDRKKARFSKHDVKCLATCAADMNRRQEVIDFIWAFLGQNRHDIEQDTIVVTGRQERLVSQLRDELLKCEEYIGLGEEIVSLHARAALDILDEFVGKSCTEDTLNAIFERFCIGK